MPSLLLPLHSRPEALAPSRSAPLRPNDPEAGFAKELDRRRRAAPQEESPDVRPAAEAPREVEDPPAEADQEAIATAPVEAQAAAEEAQGLPSHAPAATSSAQSGARPDGGAPGQLVHRATAGGAGGKPGSQGAPGQPDARAAQPGAPAALQRSDAGAPQSSPTSLTHASVASPSGSSANAGLKQPAGADDSSPRISADQIVARDPAVGRAMQVQAGLVVESLTGSAAEPASAGRSVLGDRTILTGSPATLTGNAPQSAPDAGAGLVRGLNAMVNHSGGVMTMRLDPPELGQVRVQMTIAQGTVTAHFQPATAETQAILERSLPALRAALEAHGLAAERLTVQSAPQPAAPAREQAHDQPGQERHHQDAGGGESRGRRDGAPQDRQQRGASQAASFELQAAPRRTLQGAIR